MSKLSDLIKELCPNGVEYKKLGDIEELGLVKLGRGNVISKTDIRECPGNYPIYSSSATGNGEFGRYGKYMFDYPQISWSIDGGGRFFLRKDDKYSLTNVSGWLRVLDDKAINIDYLYYVLTNEWQNKTFDYTHKAHPSVIRDEYIIPLPPLKIQQEIVKILDKFTELQAELQAELELRSKQYEHYRDDLLSFDNLSNLAGGGVIRELPINNLVNVITPPKKLTKNEYLENGSYPIVDQGQSYIVAYTNDGDAILENPPYVIFGDHTCEVKFVNTPFVQGADGLKIMKVIDNSLVNPKFLFYSMKSMHLVSSSYRRHWSDVKDRIVYIPPVSIQHKIVDVLDKFSALVSDISIGLPAEIKLRQQQYEHYRDKLLSFKPVGD